MDYIETERNAIVEDPQRAIDRGLEHVLPLIVFKTQIDEIDQR